MAPDQLEAEIRTPGMSQGEQFLLPEMLQQIANDVLRVRNHLRSRHRWSNQRGIVRSIRFSRAPLVPLHDGEAVFPRTLERPRFRHRRRARAAVDIEQYWVVTVSPAD